MWQRGALDKGSFSREKPLITSIVYFFFPSSIIIRHVSFFPFDPRLNLRCIPELDRWIVKLIGGRKEGYCRMHRCDQLLSTIRKRKATPVGLLVTGGPTGGATYINATRLRDLWRWLNDVLTRA